MCGIGSMFSRFTVGLFEILKIVGIDASRKVSNNVELYALKMVGDDTCDVFELVGGFIEGVLIALKEK